MRLIQKPDRRGPDRLATPPCSRCLSPDAVYAAMRDPESVCWRCATCGASWSQAKPLTGHHIGASSEMSASARPFPTGC